mgnify:CR=1 FL=1
MSSLTSLRNHLRTLKDKDRIMDKQISEDYDLHVDVTTDKFDKLELKREIIEIEKQITQLEADKI